MTDKHRDALSKLNEMEKQLEESRRSLESRRIELEAHEGLLSFAMEDLRRIYQDLLKSQSQLLQADKLATIGLLTAGIIHEINNPLGASIGHLEVLLMKLSQSPDKMDIDEVRDSAQISLESIKSIARIVKGIRIFSRSDMGLATSANLNEILESIVSIVWNQIKNRVTLKREYGLEPVINCNSQQIGQVLLNLIVNASQAIKDAGVITLRTYADDQFACVEVQDTGAGISPEVLPKIFEPFFTTKREEEGTGLGLSICADLVKKNGGKIEVKSEIGKGSIFTVRFPAIKPSSATHVSSPNS